jgi:hypothetical protein
MKIFWLLLMALGWMSCNNDSNDGDASTDTVEMPVDTNIHKTTSDHINRADGVLPADSSRSADSMRQ